MSTDRHSQLLEQLVRSNGPQTAGDLADALGVSARSIRTYIAAIKAKAHPLPVIEAGPDGYRLGRDAYAAYLGTASASADDGTPRERLHRIVRLLVDEADGFDVYETASALFISDSTLETDLTRVRALLADTGLTLARTGGRVALRGSELARRRLLSRLFRDETTHGMAQLDAIQREFESESLGSFKTDLIEALQDRGYYINDYGMDNVLLHIAIAADRAGKSSPVESQQRDTGTDAELRSVVRELSRTHFADPLGDADIGYIAYLLSTRAVAPRPDADAALASEYFTPDEYATVRSIAERAGEEYLVDLSDVDFLTRLTVHVSNLLERAEDQAYSRNPLTTSLKTAYPMIYELAVFIASGLHDARGIVVNDDEIAYIAMHIGAHLQQQTRRDDLATCVLVCPNYYDLQAMLADRIIQTLGDALTVTRVVTRTDVPWEHLDADLVLTTLEPPAPAENIVRIQPFLSPADVDRVRSSLSRVRRIARRASIRDQLLRYLDERLFLRDVEAESEEALIRLLGERMQRLGVIDGRYIEAAIERERMSSTAFTDTLAVPHAMEMTASRTSIAIAVNERSMPWGDGRVNVVALIAFSADGRAQFQEVFDQFVEVFSEREDVASIVRGGRTFSAFIDALVRTMDS
ncbi:BglG family transcription antiterminator [Paramicrobacterium chengjingii]|uniref:Transcription antiterminator n=1 Tax=Paramicrobacterium chengjingii TaxID=2769067 RepID=A0ABX6YL58_9MICO|nr:BglG family transcription antiterminator [Microbacterium chengjingii]QPZ39151.1 transcription antiterminator [Microbacterium chengjingii]